MSMQERVKDSPEKSPEKSHEGTESSKIESSLQLQLAPVSKHQAVEGSNVRMKQIGKPKNS
jgi:hypothetical protein